METFLEILREVLKGIVYRQGDGCQCLLFMRTPL